jgi:hypothetical protein
MTERHSREPNNKENMITPQSLLEDNQSEEAKIREKEWETNRKNGKLIAVFTCGDARIFVPSPEQTISVRSIATGGSKKPYEALLNSPGVKCIVVLSHHDGDTATPGQKPTGCGGLAAKEEANNHKDQHYTKGIGDYIEHDVRYPDPVIQALISAEEIASETDKPILAATQDHLTEEIFPIAIFELRGNRKTTLINFGKIADSLYHPSEFYANGIPILPNEFLTEEFSQFLEENKQEVARLEKEYSTLREKQKVQNPKMVVLSTDIRSMRIRYPQSSQEPGSLFKLNMPRKKDNLGVSIDPNNLIKSLEQAEYPLSHAVKNYGDNSKPFSLTDRVFLETGDIKLSHTLAEKLAQESWMKEWLALPDHKIIIAQSNAGKSNDIKYFTI